MTTFDPASPNSIRRIVIVGGGTAGWMCASALSRMIAHAGVSVTLVESDDIGTVGVGEATIPDIKIFNAMLGLDEDDFLRQTNGTFKLGIEFVDWRKPGSRYMHPFAVFGVDFQAVKFHQFWLKALASGADVGELGHYNLCAVAAALGRFTRPPEGPKSVLSSLRYAYHFDAGLYAAYLRRYSETRGVERVEGKIVAIDLDPRNGFVAAVRLQDGRSVDGELFLDCSGFRSLVLGEALKIGFESWDHWLPCNRAVAVPTQGVAPIVPYTRATADRVGWRWRIPLQHRLGNGYVYCAEAISDDDAVRQLLSQVEGAPLAEPRVLKFTAGKRQRLWHKNCIAIGLAGGFLEPLESTSIHLIQTGIQKLLALFPDKRFSSTEADEYNRTTAIEYEYIRDFIILHYKATERDDTEFWRRCRTMDIPPTLARRMALFREKGRIVRLEEDLFRTDNWLAVLIGQGVTPVGYDPLVDAVRPDYARQLLPHLRSLILRTAESMPTHDEALARIRRSATPTAQQH